VGGPSALWAGHGDAALDRRHVRGQGNQVRAQPGGPVGGGPHVVVQEDDPGRSTGVPSGLASQGGPTTARTQNPDRGVVHARQRVFGLSVHPVVDDHDLGGCDLGRGRKGGAECLSQPVPAHRRNDKSVLGRTHDDTLSCPRRRTRKGPSARTSTGAEPKHSNASRGESTMGRPDVLRLVFTSTGSPDRSSNSASRRAVSGSSSGSTVCIRAVPSTCTAAGTRSCHSGATSCTKSM